jgi:hypothetical protein
MIADSLHGNLLDLLCTSFVKSVIKRAVKHLPPCKITEQSSCTPYDRSCKQFDHTIYTHATYFFSLFIGNFLIGFGPSITKCLIN